MPPSQFTALRSKSRYLYQVGLERGGYMGNRAAGRAGGGGRVIIPRAPRPVVQSANQRDRVAEACGEKERRGRALMALGDLFLALT